MKLQFKGKAAGSAPACVSRNNTLSTLASTSCCLGLGVRGGIQWGLPAKSTHSDRCCLDPWQGHLKTTALQSGLAA
eukprot:scaffold61220_cov21-Tisochrysis_lutea.AAC.1